MQTGSIGVKTENIFPVIKKFLYSENEIFLREIIRPFVSHIEYDKDRPAFCIDDL